MKGNLKGKRYRWNPPKMLAHFRKIYFFYCFYLIWEISPKRFPQWIIDKANTCLIKCVNRHLLIYFNCLTYHSLVLGVDNLAKWQKNRLQLKPFGGSLAINLQILSTSIIQKTAISHRHKKEVWSLRCSKMHKPQKTLNDQFFMLIDTM